MGLIEPITISRQIEFTGVDRLETAPPFEGSINDDRQISESRQFIEKLKARDEMAFEELVNENTPAIYSLLVRLVKNSEEAEDLTQETFIKAFRHIDQFRAEASLRTWLFRIAINEARNYFRWWKRRHWSSSVGLDDVKGLDKVSLPREDQFRFSKQRSSDPESWVAERERQALVTNAIYLLDRKYREVLILRDIEGFQYEEISEMVGINLGTVKSRLARARQELKSRLENLL